MKIRFILFALAILMFTSTAWAVNQPDKKRIHTTGVAELKGDNDSAVIEVAIITEHKHLDTAHQENTAIANAVRKAIRKMSIKGLSIKTTNFHVYPKKDHKSKKQEIIGYKIQNTLSLNLEGKKKSELSITVSKLLDTALRHGANKIGNIHFYIKDREPLVNEALAKATKVAIRKAQTLASAANVTLGSVHTISSDSNQQPILGLQANVASYSSKWKSNTEQTPVEAGESKITATVSVSYEIK